MTFNRRPRSNSPLRCLGCILFEENHEKMPSISAHRPRKVLNFRAKVFGCLLICHFTRFFSAVCRDAHNDREPPHQRRFTQFSSTTFTCGFAQFHKCFLNWMSQKPIQLIKCAKSFAAQELRRLFGLSYRRQSDKCCGIGSTRAEDQVDGHKKLIDCEFKLDASLPFSLGISRASSYSSDGSEKLD